MSRIMDRIRLRRTNTMKTARVDVDPRQVGQVAQQNEQNPLPKQHEIDALIAPR